MGSRLWCGVAAALLALVTVEAAAQSKPRIRDLFLEEYDAVFCGAKKNGDGAGKNDFFGGVALTGVRGKDVFLGLMSPDACRKARVTLVYDRFFSKAVATGDINDDGVADLCVAAPASDGTGLQKLDDSGVVCVFAGKTPGRGQRTAVPIESARPPEIKPLKDFVTPQRSAPSTFKDLSLYFPVQKDAFWEYELTVSPGKQSLRRYSVEEVEQRPPFQQLVKVHVEGSEAVHWDVLTTDDVQQVSQGRRVLYFGGHLPPGANAVEHSYGGGPMYLRERKHYTVKVLAGKFTDCVEIVEVTNEFITRFYYAPRVGLVLRYHTDSGGRTVSSMELLKYQTAGER